MYIHIYIHIVPKSLLPANYFVPIDRLRPLGKYNINHSRAVIISNYIYQEMHIQYVRHRQLFGHIKFSYTFRQVFAIFRETMTQRSLYIHKVSTYVHVYVYVYERMYKSVSDIVSLKTANTRLSN